MSLFSSSDTPVFTKQDKAFFADPALVNFVRPGLVITITGASIAQDGTIQAQYTVTDPKSLPLDIQGITTPGTISTSFVASYIPKGSTDYVAITTRSQTGAQGTAIQPAADQRGNNSRVADGQYTYTFGTKAPASLDRNQTVTIGVYSSRDLSEFELGTNSSNSLFSFVPAGGTPADVHEVIRTETCNKCHDPLAAHGGSRRLIGLCVLCHNPGGAGTQTIDPDTGNSIDMKIMIHKIHMGEDLPSVKSGHPYQIIGFQQSVNDFSTVAFPADPRNCQMCHETGAPPQGGTAPPGSMTTANNPPPAQGDWWLTHPTRAACGACHDDVNFATGENHANLPQPNDNQCTQCHFPQGELPFDVSVIGAHMIPQFAPGLPGVAFTLVKVENGAAGQSPTVTFTVKDKSGNPLDPAQMNLLNLVMAGPTSDYATVFSEDARKATGSNGTYTYTLTNKVPADAKGTFTIGIEGYRNVTLLPNTTQQMVVRDVGFNQVIDFSVDGSPVAPHPAEVGEANCNHCHYQIQAHGTIRNNVQHCILCHNPNATDAVQRPADQNPPQSIDFPVLIHRIHKGEQAAEEPAPQQFTPFIVYGFNHSRNDFSEVRFPGDLRNCEKCHINDSQELPLPSGRITVQNPRAFIPQPGPATAACTACHVSQPASAHANLNTDPKLGEACAVCHAAGAQFSVDEVHARSL